VLTMTTTETRSYVDSAACRMVATHCACCGRELVDSISVETGVGPECRKRHGYQNPQQEENWEAIDALIQRAWKTHANWCPPALLEAIQKRQSQKAANVAVHHIAVQQSGVPVARLVEVVYHLGFVWLASRIVKRIGVEVRETEENGEPTLTVYGPYSERMRGGFLYRIPGAAWSRKRGARFSAPATSRRQVWDGLCQAYPAGTLVAGSKGVSVIPGSR